MKSRNFFQKPWLKALFGTLVLAYALGVGQPAQAAGGDYLERMDYKNHLYRWPDDKETIDVMVLSSGSVLERNFTAGMVERAFKAWASLLGPNSFRLRWSYNAKEADIVILPAPQPGAVSRGAAVSKNRPQVADTYLGGLTEPELSTMTHTIKRVRMLIPLVDSAYRPRSTFSLYTVLLHEFGHAFGLLGHSDEATDVMASVNSPTTIISPRDARTFRLLYRDRAD